MGGKIATAICPANKNATGRVNQPNIIIAPPTSFNMPANPIIENNCSLSNIATCGTPNNFAIPCSMETVKYHYHIFTVNQNRKTCQCFWNYGKKKDWGHQYFGTIDPTWINLNSSPTRPPNYPH